MAEEEKVEEVKPVPPKPAAEPKVDPGAVVELRGKVAQAIKMLEEDEIVTLAKLNTIRKALELLKQGDQVALEILHRA